MLLNQYFGQYLFNKGIINAEQLTKAIGYERSVRLKLGVLAINAGILNAAQVETIHELQKSKDKRFGELSVELGYLTLAQLEELLEVQKRRYMSLSQAIIDLGYLSLADLEQALNDYKRESNFSQEQWQALNTIDFEQAARAFLDFSAAGGTGEIYYDYVALLLRNMVRFLNEEPVLEKNAAIEKITVDNWLVGQDIVGEVELFTGLVMDDSAFLEVARRYSEEELPEIDELAIGSSAEFLNVVNGIFCVNASDQGVNLDLKPQTVEKRQTLSLHKGYRIPILLSWGKIELIIAERK